MNVYLLAHQDDEIFFLPYLTNSEKNILIFLTSGVSVDKAKSDEIARFQESKLLLDKFSHSLNLEVIWWGTNNSIPEGDLHLHLGEKELLEIQELVVSSGDTVDLILTTTFEGAHQDHDSAAILSRKIGKALNIEVAEISTYRQWFGAFYSFRVLSPRLPVSRIDFKRLLNLKFAAKLMAGYASQKSTWFGLGPALLFRFAFGRYQSETPHELEIQNLCFYQFRGRASQKVVVENLRRLQAN